MGRPAVPILADIRFGDAVTPNPKRIEYPNLLKFPAPLLRVYPSETVVAKKYQALVHLAIVSVTGKTTTGCYELISNVHRCFHYLLESWRSINTIDIDLYNVPCRVTALSRIAPLPLYDADEGVLTRFKPSFSLLNAEQAICQLAVT